MTIFKSAYDTLACRDFVMTKIRHALDAVLHTGHLQSIPGSATAKQLEGGVAIANEVPSFIHPFVMDMGTVGSHVGGQAKPFAVADVRMFGKYDIHKAAFVVGISNKTQYAFHILRTRLTNCWVQEAPSLLLNVSPMGMKTYSAWISQQVSRKLLLDARESMILQAYAAFFYWSLFQEDHPLHSNDKNRAAASIMKATGISSQLVLGVVEHFEKPLAGVEEFCRLSKEVVGSIRLAQLNEGLLFALLANTWFGNDKQEVTAVAVEHPPTWLAMVSMASQDRSYHNTEINRLIERLDRKDKGQTFVRALNVTLDAAEA
ncbi:MAG: hypothetical protein P4L77_11225 [Sulfuriferula sp.]|nr:hypothetical protein [Sulfuriferula sp.]